MILTKVLSPTCCVCKRDYTEADYETEWEWFFWKNESAYTLFQNEPYYLCKDACNKKFQLTPALYTPIAYTLRFDFKSNLPTQQEMQLAKELGFKKFSKLPSR